MGGGVRKGGRKGLGGIERVKRERENDGINKIQRIIYTHTSYDYTTILWL